PTGWSLMSRVDTSTRQLVALCRRVATASEPANYTFTMTGRNAGCPLVGVVQAYRGLDTAAALVASAVAHPDGASGNTTSFGCPSVSLTTYSDLYLGLVADHSNTATTTVPTGTTRRFEATSTTNGNVHIAGFDLFKNAVCDTGAQTVTMSVAS